MMTLEEYLEKQINEYLKQAVLSGNRLSIRRTVCSY